MVSVAIKWSIAALCYAIAPHLAIISPLRIEPTILDQAIPCMSWTVFIYLTLYFQVMFCLLTTSNIVMLRGMLQAYIWMTVILSAFYITIPVRTPHCVLDSSSFSDSVLLWIRGMDVPSNSLPSGHVAYSLLGPIFLFFYGEEKHRFNKWFFLIWGILLSLTTMTTKQHLIGDVICGFLLALGFGYVWGMYAREQVMRRLKGKDLRVREKWHRRRLMRKR